MKVKNIITLIAVLGAFGLLGYLYIWYGKAFNSNLEGWNEKEYIYVAETDNFEKVVSMLSPYLKDVESFKTIAEQRNYDALVINGRFQLRNGMNNYDIIQALRDNKPTRVTFNNQERIENLAGRISSQIEADSLALLETFLNKKFLSDNGFTQENALVIFLPDTYEFYWNVSPIKLRNKLQSEYVRFWNEERLAKAKAIGLTPIEVSILASIVQKETVKADERPKVAGAYLNRLKIGMPLQADPTLVYAHKLHTGDFEQKIYRVYNKHKELDSPYNTYRNAGLPPGPIAMSDKTSIDAVLNPEEHDYIYFCASVDRPGYHEFARTLAQHNANSARYHNYLNQAGIR
ncbi:MULTISPECIES: endolytic transglycosylase MltG [Myroides]|uniref:Endolytic murein transglycosylase n=1 Tax=Myroides albus TaxID=2562892 RepID=A0A6I3LJ17_9FLAO|nr:MULTISPECIES: endolytic transglycosylase MltG [Myroides]MTG97170.1 endolytic transglycosylase MltG [Myroides albus]MVX35167.1 endolytic transglycosylase MltG [Myroides sp. LoEW2-1]UVD78912.1 endolytic transglycosylase MltG [Myroides albus]